MWLSAQNRDFFLSDSRKFPDTSCSSVADGSRQTRGSFLLRNCAGILRVLWQIHAFLPSVLYLMQFEAEADHLHFHKRHCDLDKSQVCHHHFRQINVYELDMPFFFVLIEGKLHVSLGEQFAHANWACVGTLRSATDSRLSITDAFLEEGCTSD